MRSRLLIISVKLCQATVIDFPLHFHLCDLCGYSYGLRFHLAPHFALQPQAFLAVIGQQ
jgi:hypothetical protein